MHSSETIYGRTDMISLSSYDVRVAVFATLYFALIAFGLGLIRGQKKRGEQKKQENWDRHVNSAIKITRKKK